MKYYDLVLESGRVIDPSQFLDGLYDVAISNGRIAAIETELLPDSAKVVQDVSGQLVCPGFIDLHVHIYEWVTDGD